MRESALDFLLLSLPLTPLAGTAGLPDSPSRAVQLGVTLPGPLVFWGNSMQPRTAADILQAVQRSVRESALIVYPLPERYASKNETTMCKDSAKDYPGWVVMSRVEHPELWFVSCAGMVRRRGRRSS
jgi:hypothetical protein